MTTRSTKRRARTSRTRPFDVLVASDGSPPARAAVHAALGFPWPQHARGAGVVAWGTEHWAARFSPDISAGAARVARETERALRRRWPSAGVEVTSELPAAAIVRRARAGGVVVVGAHGYAPLERWMLGSVSRAVVRQTTASVLVVKGRRASPRHFVIGYDGSANARRAVALIAKLAVPRNGRVTVLGLCEVVRAPTIAFLPPTFRASLASEVHTVNERRLATLRRQLERASTALGAAGWRVRTDARGGVAVRDLIRVGTGLRADVLVLGARGTSGLRRLVLGSVAEAVLDRSPLPVLIVR